MTCTQAHEALCWLGRVAAKMGRVGCVCASRRIGTACLLFSASSEWTHHIGRANIWSQTVGTHLFTVLIVVPIIFPLRPCCLISLLLPVTVVPDNH
jgi:hypothetical protein